MSSAHFAVISNCTLDAEMTPAAMTPFRGPCLNGPRGQGSGLFRNFGVP